MGEENPAAVGGRMGIGGRRFPPRPLPPHPRSPPPPLPPSPPLLHRLSRPLLGRPFPLAPKPLCDQGSLPLLGRPSRTASRAMGRATARAMGRVCMRFGPHGDRAAKAALRARDANPARRADSRPTRVPRGGPSLRSGLGRRANCAGNRAKRPGGRKADNGGPMLHRETGLRGALPALECESRRARFAPARAAAPQRGAARGEGQTGQSARAPPAVGIGIAAPKDDKTRRSRRQFPDETQIPRAMPKIVSTPTPAHASQPRHAAEVEAKVVSRDGKACGRGRRERGRGVKGGQAWQRGLETVSAEASGGGGLPGSRVGRRGAHREEEIRKHRDVRVDLSMARSPARCAHSPVRPR